MINSRKNVICIFLEYVLEEVQRLEKLQKVTKIICKKIMYVSPFNVTYTKQVLYQLTDAFGWMRNIG